MLYDSYIAVNKGAASRPRANSCHARTPANRLAAFAIFSFPAVETAAAVITLDCSLCFVRPRWAAHRKLLPPSRCAFQEWTAPATDARDCPPTWRALLAAKDGNVLASLVQCRVARRDGVTRKDAQPRKVVQNATAYFRCIAALLFYKHQNPKAANAHALRAIVPAIW